MKIFLDANILVTLLNKEYPSFTYVAKVASLPDHGRFELFTSPICLAIAFYFAEKKSGNAAARNKLAILGSRLSITDTGKDTVKKVVANRSIHDFEDGLEYYSAIGAGCKCIVTEDLHDFWFSEIEVLPPQQFLEKYLSPSGK
jgi:predicted nucleic acid-binding protein